MRLSTIGIWLKIVRQDIFHRDTESVVFLYNMVLFFILTRHTNLSVRIIYVVYSTNILYIYTNMSSKYDANNNKENTLSLFKFYYYVMYCCKSIVYDDNVFFLCLI